MKAKEAFRWEVDSKRYADKNERKKLSAVIVAQTIVRRFLVRCAWARHSRAKSRITAVTRIQSQWRRLCARRLLESMKRVQANKVRVRVPGGGADALVTPTHACGWVA